MADGVVYLVGAGPGDPELITVAGQRLLSIADCVVYDKLVDRRLLSHAPASAERLYVGKETGAGSHCQAQETINELLIDRARAGKTVVRLKGGDPLLFARGAEEALALRAANISYAIVPGVTAALGVAATASIPLTHRGLSSAVAVVTGHEDPQKAGRLDWEAIGRFPGTLVLYMGLTRLASIARELLACGKSGDTPLALVERGGSNRQRVATMTLAEAANGAPAEFRSPVLVIIGEVCSLREELGWFERRPLFGQRVVVLRPGHQSQDTMRTLESLGAQVHCHPVFEIEPPDDWSAVDRAIGRLAETDWVVFSSRNGVEHFLRRMLEIGKDLRALGNCRIAAIGPGTAAALAEFHLRADVVPGEFRAESLAAALAEKVAGKRVLLARANRGREILSEELSRCGARVESVVAYCQRDVTSADPELLEQLKAGQVDWILFSSSNMALGFFRWLDDDLAEQVRRQVGLVTISPITSDAVRKAGFAVAVEASVFTLDGMVEALVRRVTSELEPGVETLPKNQAGSDDDENIG